MQNESDRALLHQAKAEQKELQARMYELMVHRMGAAPLRIVPPDSDTYIPHAWVEGAEWRRLCQDARYIRMVMIRGNTGVESKLHFHEHSELVVLQRGEIRVWVNGARHELSEGDAITIPPYNMHRILFSEPSEMLTLWFPSGEDTTPQVSQHV